ncbi:type II toxin-antitoxin system antitoxin SocA domain-containing protein [Methanoculleus sp. 10]|uniref:type II toxin-antitoxin system antitoxin SocA domain-containing protein n=1 Tax=Methanoculleus sp. 10 TaxID=430615 RepID=UPI0025CE456A|nr:type II toxin-antitoxin system antitoxin SocA domain-containing protein [Methanoculleus sp. 10]
MRKQKLINALLYAVECDNRIGRTKLLKFIFFVDLIYYNQRGTTLCGTTYIRMPKGPAEATAFQLTSESNAYFDVKTPTANVHAGRRAPGSSLRRNIHESYEYRPRSKADLTVFTPYERVLLWSVLQWMKFKRTDLISDTSHYFRLWKEFSDGEDIPLEYFQLNRRERLYLEQSGLHADGFERTFCMSILPLSTEVAGALHPLNAERIATVEEVLDSFIAAYPLPALEIFYDAYLAWDDAYRSTLRHNPSHAPALAAEGCDALCFVSHVVAMHMVPAVYREERLQEFCDTAERRFNTERNAILCDNPPSLPPDTDEEVSSLVDMAMRISLDLACSESSTGRR